MVTKCSANDVDGSSIRADKHLRPWEDYSLKKAGSGEQIVDGERKQRDQRPMETICFAAGIITVLY